MFYNTTINRAADPLDESNRAIRSFLELTSCESLLARRSTEQLREQESPQTLGETARAAKGKNAFSAILEHDRAIRRIAAIATFTSSSLVAFHWPIAHTHFDMLALGRDEMMRRVIRGKTRISRKNRRSRHASRFGIVNRSRVRK